MEYRLLRQLASGELGVLIGVGIDRESSLYVFVVEGALNDGDVGTGAGHPTGQAASEIVNVQIGYEVGP